MKKSYSAPILLAIIWTMVTAARGCGWRKVDKEKWINFNWDRNILEVKTEEISSDSIEDKQLEIIFDTEKATGEIVLKICNFSLTQSDFSGVEAETLKFDIVFREEGKLVWIKKPLGELRWRFKRIKFGFLNIILVEIAGTSLHEYFLISDEDRTEMFRFGSADNISLSYRVNSTDGDDDCVNPGNINSRDTKIVFNCFFDGFSLPRYFSFNFQVECR